MGPFRCSSIFMQSSQREVSLRKLGDELFTSYYLPVGNSRSPLFLYFHLPLPVILFIPGQASLRISKNSFCIDSAILTHSCHFILIFFVV